jgi:hypothetical protein
MSSNLAGTSSLVVLFLLAIFNPAWAAQHPRVSLSTPQSTGYVGSRAPLAKRPFLQLPIGAITPTGWLRRQLELAASGLTGHLEELDPENLGPDSGWLGGDGESWERGPYYVRGLTALAYVLHDPLLTEKAGKWLEWSIKSQDSDGYFGPPRMKAGYDWWPNMVMLQALEEYHEATGDPRVLELMSRYFAYQLRHIEAHPLTSWAKARGADNLASVLWLYDRTGERFLLDLGAILRRQTAIWDIAFANDLVPTDHGVNVLRSALHQLQTQTRGRHHPDTLRGCTLTDLGVSLRRTLNGSRAKPEAAGQVPGALVLSSFSAGSSLGKPFGNR